MAQEITVSKLTKEISEKLSLVHNLNKVYVGIREETDPDNFIQQERPHKIIPIAYGKPKVIAEAQKSISASLSKQNFYEVKMISDCDENSNMLYIFLDIDTEHNYDINDLDDDDDFTDTYTLI